uniref:protein-serine/threonine phosphatase n=1 Tax=Paramoeba aestuarina TaxID=180227 RepID=A0A7S4KHX3_9EUKA|mmetsp:Transcript_1945/g.2995  ORF Transcript_1945/g.2995 Transcript_1945/m.2995 type:complete len:511 (+) Transcript_1945:36-1568(+)
MVAPSDFDDVAPRYQEDPVSERKQGNSCFASGDYYGAIAHYSRSIELDETMVLSYLNRSLMYIRTECFGAAINDADKALRLLRLGIEQEQMKKLSAKAYFRKGYSQYVLGHTSLALQSFYSALKFMPHDNETIELCKACEKDETRRKFLIAIASEEIRRPYQVVDWRKIPLDKSLNEHQDCEFDEWEDQNVGSITREYIDRLLLNFKKGKLPHQRYATRIMLEARDIFAKFPNAVAIEYPNESKITVFGDIHGQFFDLIHLFETNGYPSTTNPYLFNGDICDRGSYSVECLLTLCAFKILLPNHFFIARGNHEGLNLNKVYGFESEMRSKYSSDMFDLSHDVFRSLPLCHVLGGTVFVVHGGLFRENNVLIDDINNKVNRFCDIPDSGLMSDMVWSDPAPDNQLGRTENKRGVGVCFGPDVTEKFLNANQLDLLVRSHEVKQDGYEVQHGGKCITVFSAPNYCGQVGNKAAFLEFMFDGQKGALSTLSKPIIHQFDSAGNFQAGSFMSLI